MSDENDIFGDTLNTAPPGGGEPPEPKNSPVTIYELEALKEQRSEPVYENIPTPWGDVVAIVNEALDLEREDRINEIEGRLNEIKNDFESDFDKALLRGTLTEQFSRSR